MPQLVQKGVVLPIKLYEADKVTHFLRVPVGTKQKLTTANIACDLDADLVTINDRNINWAIWALA